MKILSLLTKIDQKYKINQPFKMYRNSKNIVIIAFNRLTIIEINN